MDHESIDPLDHYARYCARARTLAAESLDKMTAERVANNELGRTDPDALKAMLLPLDVSRLWPQPGAVTRRWHCVL